MGKVGRYDAPGDGCARTLFLMTAILTLLCVLCVLCGCRTTRTVAVPVEVERIVTRTDTLRLNTHSVDTLLERDSVFVWQRGDTVTKEVTRWRYKVRLLTDTMWRTRVDSVLVEKPVTLTVERELTLWERVKQRFGGLALLTLLVLAALLIFRLRRR